MKSVLVCVSALTLMTASAAACPFMKTAEHHTMSVASLDKPELPMSTSEEALAEKAAVDEVVTGAIQTGEEDAE